jgi:hypothetical protein
MNKYVRRTQSQDEKISLSTIVSRPTLRPTQTIQWVPGALSLGVKRPGREADHSPPLSAGVKTAWSYTSTPNTPSWRGAQLKQRDNFTHGTVTSEDMMMMMMMINGDIRRMRSD